MNSTLNLSDGNKSNIVILVGSLIILEFYSTNCITLISLCNKQQVSFN